ncbi:MAG: radical SAM protein [Terriglobia bacterium]
MNVLLTTYCNLRCPYCFAASKLFLNRRGKKTHISLENLKTVLDFCKKSGQHVIGVLGGEPTLHPFFADAIAMIMKAGLRFTLFTNGIIRKEKDRLFLRDIDPKQCDIMININAEDFYGKAEYALVKGTLQNLRDKIQLGFNIYREDFDATFLIELINEYNLQRRIRLGIASPILGYNNQHIAIDQHRTVAEKIVDFADKCDRSDISINFDCGFALCSFTEEECGKLQYANSPLAAFCGPVIDVAPDLTVWRCFATSALWNKRLNDFKNLGEIQQFFEKKFWKFQKVGATGKCLRCKYLRRKQCGGGCLAHTMKSFNIEHLLSVCQGNSNVLA